MSVPPVQPGLSYAATGQRPEPAAVVGNGGGGGVTSAAAAAAVAAQAPPLDPLMAALADALGAAAVRQNGLAPLFANLEALMARTDLPDAVRNAAQTLLNLRLSGAAVEGGTLRQAVNRSGLFLEAVQAKGLTPIANIKSALQDLRAVLQGLVDAGTAPAVARAASPAAPAQGAAPNVISPTPAALAEAGVRQAAMSILSETEALLAAPAAAKIVTPGATPGAAPAPTSGAPPAAASSAARLPALLASLDSLLAQPGVSEAVRNAAQAVLGLRSADALSELASRPVIGASGMLLGAMLPNAAMADAVVKVTLQNLRDVLKGFLGVDSAPREARGAPPLPPFRGSLPIAQPPVPATLASGGLREAALQVLDQTDAAIARQVMLQIASLPASQQPSHPPDDHTQRFVFDIPLTTPQGTAVMQLQIEREAPQKRGQQAPVWSVRFAVDIEPLGAVRARVSQIGDKTSVTLVAEKPASAAALQANIASLQMSLARAQLEPGDLHCLTHDQTKVVAPQGQFVNRAS